MTKVKDELSMWEGRKVMMLLPVYRSFEPWTHFTLFANYAKYGPEKIGIIQEIATQIHEGRNTLIHKAKKTDAEYFIFCDDDMVIPCGSAGIFHGNLRAPLPEPGVSMVGISRLMSFPPDMRIVGALYFNRRKFSHACCSDGYNDNQDDNNDKFRAHTIKEPILQRWISPGFMRIHRSVFDDLDLAIKNGKFPECIPSTPDRPVGYFNPIRAGMGEDVSFGVRCGEIGVDSWLDPVLECLHSDGPGSHYGSFNTENVPRQ